LNDKQVKVIHRIKSLLIKLNIEKRINFVFIIKL